MKRIIIGLLSGIFFLSACGQALPATQLISVSETPLPTETLAATQTFTPEPTATFISTETPMPQIDLSKSIVWGADGKPVLSPWGTVKTETTKGFEVLPSIVDLENQLGVPGLGWTPEFIRRWHASLMQASVNGVPVVPTFDPNTVCDISWRTAPKENKSRAFTMLIINTNQPCKTGTFPIAFVAGFTDNRPVIYPESNPYGIATPLAAFTYALWNPRTQQTELRTFAYSQHMEPGTSTFQKLGNEGAYPAPKYNIQIFHPEGELSSPLDWFIALSAQTGSTIYDANLVDASYASEGLYADGLDQTVLLGSAGVQPIDHSSP